MQIPARLCRTSPSRPATGACAVFLGLLVASALTWSTDAAADTLIIKRPGYHPRYSFEAEPHLLIGLMDPPGPANGNGIGVGFRGTIPLVHNGFVPSINNSVGIGFGIDFVHYGYGSGRCRRFNSFGDCEYSDANNLNAIWLPVVMQWNFFLSKNWSVFGEPGLAFRYESNGDASRLRVEPIHLYVGGRFHFSETVTLTMRLGYPTFSVGVSFLL